jgi:hypothetical protein
MSPPEGKGYWIGIECMHQRTVDADGIHLNARSMEVVTTLNHYVYERLNSDLIWLMRETRPAKRYQSKVVRSIRFSLVQVS